MTEHNLIEMISQKLETFGKVQSEQGKDIKELTKAFAAQAVHNEQLRSTQAQVTALWDKFDDYYGPTGLIGKIREHQAKCPKDELIIMRRDSDRSTKRIWAAIGLLASLIVGLAAKGHI